jgi:hypothetical protein
MPYPLSDIRLPRIRPIQLETHWSSNILQNSNIFAVVAFLEELSSVLALLSCFFGGRIFDGEIRHAHRELCERKAHVFRHDLLLQVSEVAFSELVGQTIRFFCLLLHVDKTSSDPLRTSLISGILLRCSHGDTNKDAVQEEGDASGHGVSRVIE